MRKSQAERDAAICVCMIWSYFFLEGYFM